MQLPVCERYWSEITCFFQKGMTKSKLHKNKKNVLKFFQYWVPTCKNQKCKIRISLNLLDKLTL